MSLKKNIKANYRFHYKQPMPGVDCSLFNMHQALYLSPASPPLPKRQLHTDLAHCSQTLTIHTKNNNKHFVERTPQDTSIWHRLETISGWSIYNYKRRNGILSFQEARKGTYGYMLYLQGYLHVTPKRLLKLFPKMTINQESTSI